MLKIENPERFKRTGDIGAFVGPCPKRNQTAETDKELRISKCGDRYLRRLLVGAAQYILGPFAPKSALRDYGLRLAQDGTAKAKEAGRGRCGPKASWSFVTTLPLVS